MLYRVIRALCRIVYKTFFLLRATGVENVPTEGPVILCSNHISVLDPPTIGTPLERKVHFMAKQELFQIPLFNRFITALGAYPVNRGGISKQSIRLTTSMLNEGRVVGIFPEGTRKNPGVGKKGAANFALKTGAVVIPVAIIGQYRLFRRMNVVYGEPVDLTSFNDGRTQLELENATKRIMDAIYDLME